MTSLFLNYYADFCLNNKQSKTDLRKTDFLKDMFHPAFIARDISWFAFVVPIFILSPFSLHDS